MVRTTVVTSDLSGKTIKPGKVATIIIRFADARKGGYVLDVSEAEAHELGKKGRRETKDERRPEAVAE